MYAGMYIYDTYEHRPVECVSEEQAEVELQEYDETRFCLARLYLEPYKMPGGFEYAIEHFEIV